MTPKSYKISAFAIAAKKGRLIGSWQKLRLPTLVGGRCLLIEVSGRLDRGLSLPRQMAEAAVVPRTRRFIY
jgi:hypothetical protein